MAERPAAGRSVRPVRGLGLSPSGPVGRRAWAARAVPRAPSGPSRLTSVVRCGCAVAVRAVPRAPSGAPVGVRGPVRDTGVRSRRSVSARGFGWVARAVPRAPLRVRVTWSGAGASGLFARFLAPLRVRAAWSAWSGAGPLGLVAQFPAPLAGPDTPGPVGRPTGARGTARAAVPGGESTTGPREVPTRAPARGQRPRARIPPGRATSHGRSRARAPGPQEARWEVRGVGDGTGSWASRVTSATSSTTSGPYAWEFTTFNSSTSEAPPCLRASRSWWRAR